MVSCHNNYYLCCNNTYFSIAFIINDNQQQQPFDCDERSTDKQPTSPNGLKKDKSKKINDVVGNQFYIKYIFNRWIYDPYI